MCFQVAALAKKAEEKLLKEAARREKAAKKAQAAAAEKAKKPAKDEQSSPDGKETKGAKAKAAPAIHAILIALKAGECVVQTVLRPKQCVRGSYSGTATVADTFWRPGGV